MDDDYGYDCWERDDDYNVFEERCLDEDRAAGEYDDLQDDGQIQILGTDGWVWIDTDDAREMLAEGELVCDHCGADAETLMLVSDDSYWPLCRNCEHESRCDGAASAAYEDAAYGIDY